MTGPLTPAKVTTKKEESMKAKLLDTMKGCPPPRCLAMRQRRKKRKTGREGAKERGRGGGEGVAAR